MKVKYETKEYLQKPSEHRFYKVLNDCVRKYSPEVHVVPQVQLSRIIDHKCDLKGHDCDMHFYKGFGLYSFDYVLFDKSFRPLVAVELNDISHLTKKRSQRDNYVQRICADAKLPLVTFPVSRAYDEDEIIKKIQSKFRNK